MEIPPFSLRDGQLLAFANPDRLTNPLHIIVETNTVTKTDINAFRTDDDKWRWIIELLHANLRDHCYKKELVYNKEYDKFYFPASPLKTRKISWKSEKRRAERQVASYYSAGGASFYLHRAVNLRFITLGEHVYLMMDPGLLFTSDGRTPITSERFRRMSTHLTHDQYNLLVLNDIQFWASVLSTYPGKIRISSLDCEILINTKPAGTLLNVGVEEKIPPEGAEADTMVTEDIDLLLQTDPENPDQQ
jgi:hypothetical protein